MQQSIYNDVFISYSRKNRDFAQKLVDAIETYEQRDVWVDWEDIEYSENWWSKIQAGIESANAFVFIISPHSANSQVCYNEAEHAASVGKRIIPVLHEELDNDLDYERLHPAVKLHNWLPFREGNDFDATFELLLQTLQTDFAHVRTHTRLLVRAKEWADDERQTSRLLTGVEIQEAIDWLDAADSQEKDPTPIELHREYIYASRMARRRRQQQLYGGIGVGVVIAALAVLSFVLFQNAQQNLTLAEARGTEVAEQAATSDFNALIAANNAQTAQFNAGIAADNAETADFNAIVAANNASTALARSTEVADQAATSGANEEQAVAARSTSDANAATAVSAQDEAVNQAGTAESYRSTAESDAVDQGETAVAALATSQQRGTEVVNQAATADANAEEAQVARSTSAANAAEAVVARNTSEANEEEAVSARSTSDANLIEAWTIQSRFYADLAAERFSVGDTQTALLLALQALENYEAGVSDPDALGLLVNILGSPVQEVAEYQVEGQVGSVFVSSDEGDTLFGYGRDGTVALWDLTTGEPIYEISTGFPITRASMFDFALGTMITFSADGRLVIWDAINQEAILQLQHESGVTTQIRDAESERLATGTQDGVVRIWDLDSGEQLQLFRHGAPISQIRWLDDGAALLVSSDDGVIRRWDTETGVEIFLVDTQTRTYTLVQLNDEQDLMLTNAFSTLNASEPLEVGLYDLETGEQIDAIVVEGRSGNVQWSNDEDRIAILDIEDTTSCIPNCAVTLLVYNISSREMELRLPIADAGGLIWSEDDSELILYGGSRSLIERIDASTGESLMTYDMGAASFVAQWDEETDRLIAWSRVSDQVRMWRASTGEVLGTVYQEDLNYVSWNPANDLLFTYDNQGYIRQWELDNAGVLPSLSFDAQGFRVTMNGDNTQAIVPSTGNYWVWDVVTGEVLLHFTNIRTLSWSPDETRLLAPTTDEDCEVACDETLTVYDATTGDILQKIPDTGILYLAEWIDDGERILVGDNTGALRIWDVASESYVFTTSLSDQTDAPEDLNLRYSLNADGTYLAGYDRNLGNVYVWDATTGDLLMEYFYGEMQGADFEGTTYYLSISRLVSGSQDGNLTILDVTTETVIFERDYNFTANWSAFSPNETQLMVPIADGEFALLDVETGEEIFRVPSGLVNGIIWSPDESQIAFLSANFGGAVTIFDARTGELLQTLETTNAPNVGGGIELQWNADGSRILVVHFDDLLGDDIDGLARIWDVETGELIIAYRHPGDPRGGVWSQNEENVLIYGTTPGSVARLYPTATENLIAAAQAGVIRPLSPLERTLYFLPEITPMPTATGIPLVSIASPTPLPPVTPLPTVPPPSAAELLQQLNLPFVLIPPVFPDDNENRILQYSLVDGADFYENENVRLVYTPSEDDVLYIEVGTSDETVTMVWHLQASPYDDLDGWLDETGFSGRVRETAGIDSIQIDLQSGARLFAFQVDGTLGVIFALDIMDEDTLEDIMEETLETYTDQRDD